MPRSATKDTDLVWYENRKKALLAGIDDLIVQYEGEPFNRSATVIHLLKRLRVFGEGHFNFFRDGFQGRLDEQVFPMKRGLEESLAHSSAYVLASILSQIGYDLEVIQRAANHRRYGTKLFHSQLQKADKLGKRALSFAIKKNRLEGETDPDKWATITYFQKAATIRVIPYANVALIGIPMSCLGEERDFLSIPHEMGHMVYRKRKKGVEPDSLDLSYIRPKDGIPEKYSKWQEELFADVYGAAIGGVIMGFDFQELAYQSSGKEFIQVEDPHPMPLIRPLIYIKVLNHLGQGDLAKALLGRWNDRI